MRKTIVPVILAMTLLLSSNATPTTEASTLTDRCAEMTRAVNARRSPDLRTMYLLCSVASKRVYEMAHARRIWHDLTPIKRALANAHVCWKRLGEVVAWHTSWVRASTFVSMWWHSTSHYAVLHDSRYDRGGGTYSGANGFQTAVYYVIDRC